MAGALSAFRWRSGPLPQPRAFVHVEEAVGIRIHTCRPDDDLRAALHWMADFKVRRLPVVNMEGDLKGVISIDDIILWGVGTTGIALEDLTSALRSICAPHAALAEQPTAEV